jgi:hypothetical protein
VVEDGVGRHSDDIGEDYLRFIRGEGRLEDCGIETEGDECLVIEVVEANGCGVVPEEEVALGGEERAFEGDGDVGGIGEVAEVANLSQREHRAVVIRLEIVMHIFNIF